MDYTRALQLLTSRKVLEHGVWRAYDEYGVAIDDPDGVLLMGVHGAMLLGNIYAEAPEVPPVYIPQMQAFGSHPVRDWIQVPHRKRRRNKRDEILFLTH